MAAWVRYRFYRAIALPRPIFWNGARYPRTPVGGWRYFREWVAPAEVALYEVKRWTTYG
ncbi:hypothetical protein AB0B94_31010 [Micromonospora sp. NPDC048986]|uniref:hypothetical protein n=1 Tax=Micromonospora sp. NPDC048986 TaxID=3155644 RepID=UPI0033E1456B